MHSIYKKVLPAIFLGLVIVFIMFKKQEEEAKSISTLPLLDESLLSTAPSSAVSSISEEKVNWPSAGDLMKLAFQKREYEKIGSEELSEILRKDDICRLLRSDFGYSEGRKFIVELPSGEPQISSEEIDWLFGSSGYYTAKAQDIGPSSLSKYIYAMEIGGFVEGMREALPQNLQKAEELITELQSEDPQNAIYGLIRTELLEQLKRDPSEVRRAFDQAILARNFKDPYQKVLLDLEKRGYENPTTFIYMTNVVSQLPLAFPFLPVSRRLISEIESRDLAFVEKIQKLCLTMMKSGFDEMKTAWTHGFGIIQYAVGRSCYLKANKKLKPEGPQPKIKQYTELQDVGKVFKYDNINKVLDRLVKTKQFSCQRLEFDSFFYELKEKLRRK